VTVYDKLTGAAKGDTVWILTAAGTETTVIDEAYTRRKSFDDKSNSRLPARKPENDFV
jgi:hypothetical protein